MKDIFIHPDFAQYYLQYPVTLIDVGSSGGIPCVWKKAKKHLKVIGFEPDKRAFEDLQKDAVNSMKFINTALSNHTGDATLFLSRKQECSSLFRPNAAFINQFPDPARYEIIDTVEIKVEELTKKLLEKEGVTDADFLKVDTQGQDLFVLEGAQELIGSEIFGVSVEAEFAAIYKDQPMFSEIDQFLRKNGFQLFEMKRYYWKRAISPYAPNAKGQLIFADTLYLKNYESLISQYADKDRTLLKAKILKAVSLSCLYNKNDYALYLTKRAQQDGILCPSETELIFKKLQKKRFRFSFRGQQRLGRLFYRLYLYFKSDKFYFSDEEMCDGK